MDNPFVKKAPPAMSGGEWDAEQRQIEYERKIAEQIMAQSEEPLQGQMVGGIYVAPSWTQGLAKALSPVFANQRMRAADEREAQLSQQRNADLMGTMQAYQKALNGTPQEVLPKGVYGPPGPAREGSKEAAMNVLMQSRHPAIQQAVMAQMLQELTPEESVVVGRSLLGKRTGAVKGVDQTWQSEQQANRAQRLEEQQARFDQQRQMAQLIASTRQGPGPSPITVLDESGNPVIKDARTGTVYGRAPAGASKAPAGYRFTPEGNLEMIPGGPADAKAQQRAEGGSTVEMITGKLRDSYNRLDKAGAITNPENGALRNAGAWAGSSAAGQAAGRLLGTANQSIRNEIAQTRPLLLQAIMKATGMSAKQMDSNRELQLYLSAATDPTLDVKANKQALDMLEKLYGSGRGQAGNQAPDNPEIDDLLKKYGGQ